jgi:hypothetical protein
MRTILVNPMNEAVPAAAAAAPRLPTLSGKVVALLDISKPGGSVLLDRLALRLTEEFSVARIVREKKPTFSKPAPATVMERLLAEHPDAVIEALAD